MSQNSKPMKCTPRLVMILLGTPKQCIICSMNWDALADSMLVTAFTSIHFVNLSIATKICV